MIIEISFFCGLDVLVKQAGTVEQNHEMPFIQKIKKDFADVFTSIGKLQGECTIHLKPGTVPTVHPVRCIPFTLHDKLKSELEQLEKQGIIQKVTTPMEWVHSIVTVEKQNGSPHLKHSANLDGLGGIVDDIIVSGKDDKNNRDLVCVLERARKEGVKFNPEKCIFGAPSIPYFGHVMTAEGIKPYLRKFQAIKDMPYPTSTEELMMFLGMVNFLSCYVPNLSTLNHSFRVRKAGYIRVERCSQVRDGKDQGFYLSEPSHI
ncbi:hypothetical protein QYM36_019382 [Artemia franciscana]|uniref:Uncharacterized protein n=1 Tax=Artemia franciscana TaxID=6661 RepID=A0AA88H1A0_ARTSF|nr:hypothetical protein QYM36_019382 [Artemia franciscana]